MPVVNATLCLHCGKPIVPGEPFVVFRWPSLVHEKCMSFAGHPFHWARAIKALRLGARVVADPAPVLELAAKLEALQPRWPAEAHAVLAEGRELMAAARTLIESLPPHVRTALG